MLREQLTKCIILIIAGACLARDAHIVDQWADKIGTELRDLAHAVARPDELKEATILVEQNLASNSITPVIVEIARELLAKPHLFLGWANNVANSSHLHLTRRLQRIPLNVVLSKYKTMNTIIVDKSGEELIKIISESVGRMLRRKMDAVRCILKVAESAAEEYAFDQTENITYVSGKYSNATIYPSRVLNKDDIPDLPETMKANKTVYRIIDLEPDSHFYNIPVNTTHSSVHIPTNVYDLRPKVMEAIEWSEALDEIFRQNYNSDPALSWQYFGSITGMLRQYPAMMWRTATTGDGSKAADQYDCRTRSWFIEAATCSKDMVILVDTSGSMEGMGRTIAIATISAILDTLSNNDYVTVLQYTNITDEMVPCFKDKLIQATPENIDIFKNMSLNMDPSEIANLTEAFTRAFSLLKTYRDIRGCGSDTPCNQLIMLVTDGVASNVSEVFDLWNRQENGTHIPVRVFTYLLGREITMVQEIQLMACLNRGYYTPIKTQEEVQEQVLKYIPVVARPLVLQGDVHPIVWTHAYVDVTNPALATWLWEVMEHEEQKSRLEKYLKGKKQGVKRNEDAIYIKQLHKDENIHQSLGSLNTTSWQEYRLLTSVSIPAFDRKENSDNNTRRANLLGVAGTDVPIDEIRRLTLPYKLGVNGYAFIVSNNGYVILHPDLRPVYEGNLKKNYNSIDLTEVEILDDGRGPRDPGPEVLALRAALVDHKNDSMLNVPVKFHYDDNRRVTLEKRDYYFAPLPGTPFGIAVAIPNYGKTWIKVKDEIKKTRNQQQDISDFFVGDRWRVHPGWVYCRYHYLEGHEFDNAESELMNFLNLMDSSEWVWSEQYMAYANATSDDPEDPDCGHRTLRDHDYYCNQELMELLVFDAKATNSSYAGDFVYRDKMTKKLVDDWGIFLRFVATQSGLTRWQDVEPRYAPDEEDRIQFGDLHRRAVNEPWYKGAIFQNQIDHYSLSITVPWEAGPEAVVTVASAIVPRDGGRNSSAAVVGFQLTMNSFSKRFKEITSQYTTDYMDCSRSEMDCYLIDQNGFVVISEAHNDTGHFLGTVEGAVMKSMVDQGFYVAVDIYDYQALCSYVGTESAASIIINPLRYIGELLLWIFGRLLWMTTKFSSLPEVFAKPEDDLPEPGPKPREVLKWYSCDEKRTLYIMNQTMANQRITDTPELCSRPFYAQRVPFTNLLLLAVDTASWTCAVRFNVNPSIIDPSEYINGTEPPPCHKKVLNDLPRRRLANCYTEHPEEDDIDACGRGPRHFPVVLPILTIIIVKILL